MSLTGQIITTTLTSISAATTSADPLGRPLIPPDAIRFFIIAATVCVFFGSVTCACCISYRVRKARMRRVVIAAFEQVRALLNLGWTTVHCQTSSQGIFDRETVQQRMAYMRRGDPNVNILFPVSNSQIPEYFDKLGKPIGLDKVDRYRDVENLNLQDTIFLVCPTPTIPPILAIYAFTKLLPSLSLRKFELTGLRWPSYSLIHTCPCCHLKSNLPSCSTLVELEKRNDYAEPNVTV